MSSEFWGRVICQERDDTCWEWQGPLNHNGYGRFYSEGKRSQAHRVAWELTFGSVPESVCVCHKCDNPSCVNPAHLFLGSRADNLRDMDEKGRRSHGRAHSKAMIGKTVRGEKHYRAKLVNAQVFEIRHRYAAGGVLQRELADEFGIDRSQVSHIVNMKSWRHLGGNKT